jgi:hypothetical protein
VSKSGRPRCIARYAVPSRLTKLPGECETLLRASGSSLPRDDVETMRLTPGRNACRTSQQRASSAAYAAGAALVPFARNWGRQK